MKITRTNGDVNLIPGIVISPYCKEAPLIQKDSTTIMLEGYIYKYNELRGMEEISVDNYLMSCIM